MNGQEVIKALAEGKKVRVVHWSKECYINLINNKLCWETGSECNYALREIFGKEWEIYKQPEILFKDVPDGQFFKYKGLLGVKKKLEHNVNGFYKCADEWITGLFLDNDIVEYPVDR